MGRITDRGAIRKDSPLLTGGWKIGLQNLSEIIARRRKKEKDAEKSPETEEDAGAVGKK